MRRFRPAPWKTYTPLIAARRACAAQGFTRASRGGPGPLARVGCYLIFCSFFIYLLFFIFLFSVFILYHNFYDF
jgi:hypothetical protein